MGLIKRLKGLFSRRKKDNKLLLDSPQNLYSDLINDEKIETIISNMPKDLFEIEKAYYIYIEFAKLLNEDPHFVLGNLDWKKEHYNDKIDSNYFGICKSISELYVNTLKDERIGIDADLVKAYPEHPFSHVDTVLKIGNKKYMVNLISDLGNAKTSKRLNSFCFDIHRGVIQGDYIQRLEEQYGKIDFLEREEIEQLDKKLGYSYFSPSVQKSSDRGIYTNDVINMVEKELRDPKKFKEHILHNKDVPDEEILKYKLDYLFQNVNKYTHYNSNKMEYLENIRYLLYIARKMILPNEDPNRRIESYTATQNEDYSNIISILKVNTIDKLNANNKSFYYLYAKDMKTYIEKSPEEMREFLESLDKNSLKIIGSFDREDEENYKSKNLKEELQL